MSLNVRKLDFKLTKKEIIANYNKFSNLIKSNGVDDTKFGFELEYYLIEDSNLFNLTNVLKQSIYSDLYYNSDSIIDDSTNGYENWILTKDDSLDKYSNLKGIELISPMLDYDELQYFLYLSLNTAKI